MADEERDVRVDALAKFLMFALALGLILGIVTLAGVKLLGVGGSGDSTKGSSDPSDLPSSLPSVALSVSPSATPSATPTATPTPQGTLTLAINPPQVGQSEKIYLTGTYTGKNGITLQVQRLEAGSWTQFADVTVGVHDGAFSTYILTSRTGAQQFRVLDPSDGTASTPATVTVG
ncbi:MAG: hypothetical protein JWO46_1985 [Nocardioidaceae bacterium]|nr:hypothetical protein [Nocardioidaceae bacterium]